MRTSQLIDELRDRATLARAPDDADAGEPPEDLDGRVRAHAQHGEQRLAATVAAQEHDAGAERSRRRAHVDLRAAARRRAGRGLGAGERSQERHLAVALRARDPEDLALPDLEIDRAEALALQTGHGEHHLGLLGQCAPLRERDRQRPADHQRDERVLGDRRGLERPLPDAVAQHGDAIGDREHLGQAVADVEDADARLRLLVHKVVEVLDGLGPERRRRLVEQQHLRPGQQCLGDLEELPVGERERAGRAP